MEIKIGGDPLETVKEHINKYKHVYLAGIACALTLFLRGHKTQVTVVIIDKKDL